MQGSFTSHSFNITALLGRASFPNYAAKSLIVPQFQRGYSWEKSHVSTFWDDFLTFHKQLKNRDAQDSYFFGPIVILPETDKINLLDGQQRLATSTILFSVIRDIARTKGGQAGSDLARDIHRDHILVDDEKGIFSLSLSELDDPFFRANVQEDPPSSNVKATLRSHRLIRQARNFLYTEVDKLVDGMQTKKLVSVLKSLWKTLYSNLKLVAIEVRSEEEAYLIFETLNDRGLRLAVPDLVLNYLMRTANNASERKIIRTSWNSVVENLGQRKVSTFVRHMWVSRYGDVKKQGLFREIRDNLIKYDIGSREFAELCADESDHYIAITNLDPDFLSKDTIQFIEPLIKNLGSDRSLPVILSGLVCLNSSDFLKLSKIVVSVVTRHSILSNLNPSELEDALYKAARAIRSADENGKSSRVCFKAAKKILQKINPTDEQIKSILNDIYLTKSQALYIIYAITEQAQTKTKAVKLKRNSLEHIFPENPDKSEWPKLDEMEPFLWHIGNLTVLEPKYNRKAGSKSFDKKRELYENSKFY